MDERDRPLASSTLTLEETAVETSLRPRSLAEYIGQPQVKQNLEILLAAARQREEAADHVLLYGPPGLGKTTLANIVARELGVNLHTTSGPAIERPGDLAAILTNLDERDVLFIDEIHRLNHSVEELLYPAMEDFAIDVMIGRGPAARSLRLNLKPFTVVGATTRAGRVGGPLRDRFGAVYRLDYYEQDELATIIARSAGILGVDIEPDAVTILARRGRGTPRVVNRLLRRVRDYAQVRADGRIGTTEAEQAMAAMDIDEVGLDTTDRRLLAAIVQKFASGPVGGAAVAAVIGEEIETIEDVYEPYLLQVGFLDRTPQGRVATERAREHLARLGYDIPPQRRAERADAGLWDGVTAEGRATESELPA
jgi:holliday junction DNA helicase RuvB